MFWLIIIYNILEIPISGTVTISLNMEFEAQHQTYQYFSAYTDNMLEQADQNTQPRYKLFQSILI